MPIYLKKRDKNNERRDASGISNLRPYLDCRVTRFQIRAMESWLNQTCDRGFLFIEFGTW